MKQRMFRLVAEKTMTKESKTIKFNIGNLTKTFTNSDQSKYSVYLSNISNETRDLKYFKTSFPLKFPPFSRQPSRARINKQSAGVQKPHRPFPQQDSLPEPYRSQPKTRSSVARRERSGSKKKRRRHGSREEQLHWRASDHSKGIANAVQDFSGPSTTTLMTNTTRLTSQRQTWRSNGVSSSLLGLAFEAFGEPFISKGTPLCLGFKSLRILLDVSVGRNSEWRYYSGRESDQPPDSPEYVHPRWKMEGYLWPLDQCIA